MTFNCGIDPFHGIVGFEDSKTGCFCEFNVVEVNYNSDADQIKEIFETIKSKTTEKLNFACVCLDSGYDNEIRKKIIKIGLDCGFKDIKIIDKNTALYFDSIYKNNLKLAKKSILWIFYSNNCYIWQKENKIVKFIYRSCQPPEKVLSTLKEKYSVSEVPNIIFNKSGNIELEKLQNLFPKCQIFNETEAPNWAKGAFVKAENMAGNSNYKEFDANTVLGQPLTLIYGNDEIFSLPFFINLPISKSIILQSSCDSSTLKVVRSFPTPEIHVPECGQFCLKLSIDSNGIDTIEITAIDNTVVASTSQNMTYCIGFDPNRGEVSAYSMTSNETITNIFNITRNENNIDLIFQKIKKFIPVGIQNIIIHIDDDCFNEILMEYIKASQRHNIKNISFISTQTAEFLNIINNHREYIKNVIQTIAYICDRFEKRKIYCQVWKRTGNSFEAIKSYCRESAPGDDESNLLKLKEDSSCLNGIDLVFIDSMIDVNKVNTIFPNLNFTRIDYFPEHSKAAMLKARALADTSVANIFDVENNLNRRITFLINNEAACNIPLGQSLPYAVTLDKAAAITYKICERNAGGRKEENEFNVFSNHAKTVKLCCDINGIFSLKFA